MTVSTIFLDAVGTLFGLREAPGTLYARFAQDHGIAVDPAAIAQHFGPSWKAAAPPDYRAAPDPESREGVDCAWWHAIVQQTFLAAGSSPSQASFDTCFDAIFAHYGTAAPWHVYPDTREVLPRLRDRGYRLVVLSNFDQRLVQVMESLDLRPLVDEVLYSSALAACKPAPEAFSRALQRVASQPETSLHVGDDPETDGRGAAAAGLRFFYLQRPEIDLSALESHLEKDSIK